MPRLNLNSTLGELEHIPELGDSARYVMYSCAQDAPGDYTGIPISAVRAMGWSPEGMVRGVNCLLDQYERGARPLFVYPPEEREADERKRDVNVIRLVPERIDPSKPFLLLISGGGYQNVCSATESYPTATHFLERGYQVFVLTYRVGGIGLLPMPLEDVAAALRAIHEREAEYRLDGDNYVVCGWSAGGNLTVTWGTENVGWRHYGLPKPQALFTVYPAVDLGLLDEEPGLKPFLETMLGADYAPELLDEYNVARHIDGNYPPCFIVCGKDDATVPCIQSERLKAQLDAAGVSSVFWEVEHAAHGFGDGTGTDAEHWPEAALDFLERI